MISVSGKKWKERKLNKNLCEKIQQDYNFSRILSQLIVSRNFDKEEIYLINNYLELSNIFQKLDGYNDPEEDQLPFDPAWNGGPTSVEVINMMNARMKFLLDSIEEILLRLRANNSIVHLPYLRDAFAFLKEFICWKK